jgi:hypothetical protein
MSSLEHPGSYAHSIPSEWGYLILIAAFTIGIALTLPWW